MKYPPRDVMSAGSLGPVPDEAKGSDVVVAGRLSPSNIERDVGSSRQEGMRARVRLDWRRGGDRRRRWDTVVLAGALIGLGVGLMSVGAADRLVGASIPFVGSAMLWFGMSAAVVFAFARAKPRGLLKLRSVDLLWGLGLGVVLRLLQGWMSGSSVTPFPTIATLDGRFPQGWWFEQALPAGLIAPLVEEFFFRGVVLVSTYIVLKQSIGNLAAAFSALLFSSGLFVMTHAITGPLSLMDGVQLLLLALTCSLLVLLSGRIWGAIIVHLFYNWSFLVLSLIGTVLA